MSYDNCVECKHRVWPKGCSLGHAVTHASVDPGRPAQQLPVGWACSDREAVNQQHREARRQDRIP